MDYRRKSHGFRSPKELYTAATTWKKRSGRIEGPEEYVVGDLVRSIVFRLRAMPQRERQELYGCPVLLIGICSASGLSAVDDDARLYCSLRTADEDGNDLKSGRLITALASVGGGSVHFDDVLLLGTSGDLDRVATMTLRIKRYNGVLRKQTLVGEVAVPMRKIIAAAHADMPPCEIEYNLFSAEKAGVAAAARLHVKFFLHYPPPDPRPIAVYVTVAEGRSLLPRDTTGFSDPYVKVRPMLLKDKPAREANSGRVAEFRTSTQVQTLSPAWNDKTLFVDDRASVALAAKLSAEDGSAFPWGDFAGDSDALPAASDAPAMSTPVTKISADGPGEPPATLPPSSTARSRVVCENVSEVQGLHFHVLDWDAVTADDDMGECFVSLSSLFGDEDAVVGCHTLSVHKWVRLRPTKSLADSGFDLGHLLVHITLLFEQPLLPPLWQESVDTATGREYYYHTRTLESQWNEPDELVLLRAQRVFASPLASGAEGNEESDAILSRDITSSTSTAPSVAQSSSSVASRERHPTRLAAPSDYADSPEVVGDDDDDDIDEDSIAQAHKATAAVPLHSSSASKPAGGAADYKNPLAGARNALPQGGNAADRDNAFFHQMRAEAGMRKQTEELKIQSKLASMTPDERAEFELERANEQRRDQRKSRMLQSSFGAYAASTASHSHKVVGPRHRAATLNKKTSGRHNKLDDPE